MKPSRRITSDELSQRKFARRFLKSASRFAFWLLVDLEIIGEENFPEEGAGPLLMVGNHFSMVDIAAFVRVAPYPAEFIGGAIFVNAPRFLAFLPRMWGYLPVFRGTGSSFALREAEKVLSRNGMLAIFPEGGSHGRTLRPPRPGSAFLAARTKARIIPIGLIGMDGVFEKLGKFKRPKIKIIVGEPFGPYEVTSKGKERRAELDRIGDEIMRRIAALIPPEKHGYLSDDPELRGQVVEYPWEDSPEGEVGGSFQRALIAHRKFCEGKRMKTLLLMRHAKSSWSNPKLADHDRPLNSRGKTTAPKMGEFLTHQNVIPEVILCSTAERAKQTVEYLLQTMPFEGDLIYSRMLYHAGDEVFLEELSKLGDNKEITMIVGHNPGMEYAVETYCGEWHRMPTAAIARIEFPISSWIQLSLQGEGELAALWRPKEI